MGIEYLENLVKETYEAGKPIEGSADTDELAHLANLASDPRIKMIGEIGFNAGISSYTFLEANPDAAVYSFDLGEYAYVAPAKEYIDRIFPGRHTLILGNSVNTVPEFRKTNPRLMFDLIFIDGGHDYEIVMADLLNMREFATKETL
ncbi:MAG: hypothetical protein JWL85_998, partial [Candidatus Saccharibacteria bacterium]|nr:hypothetical protein [Candidatus Saccharibacteria bacterium]